MEKIYLSFGMGFLITAIFIVIFNSSLFSLGSQAKKAIATCEASLPRNQRCVLTAIPEKEQSK